MINFKHTGYEYNFKASSPLLGRGVGVVANNHIISILQNYIRMKKTTLFFAALFLINSCITHKQDKGLVLPKSDVVNINFTTVRNLILLPVTFEGAEKQFILDTGDDLTTINRKTPKGRVSKVNSATGQKAKVGNEIVNSIMLSELEFQKICAKNLNFDYVEKEVPNFGGLLGQATLSKANWLIDYPNKNIKISTKAIETIGYQTINLKSIRKPEISINIDGETYQAFVDLGSSTALSVVETSLLGKKLAQKITFTEGPKETFTASGVNNETVKRGILPSLKVGNIELKNTSLIMPKTSSVPIRIGMSFFKDCILYLDYTNKVYKMKKTV